MFLDSDGAFIRSGSGMSQLVRLLQEVTSKFSLGGVQATTGGSMKKFESSLATHARQERLKGVMTVVPICKAAVPGPIHACLMIRHTVDAAEHVPSLVLLCFYHFVVGGTFAIIQAHERTSEAIT